MEFNRKNMYKKLFNQTFEAQKQREYAIQRVLRIIYRLEINRLYWKKKNCIEYLLQTGFLYILIASSLSLLFVNLNISLGIHISLSRSYDSIIYKLFLR